MIITYHHYRTIPSRSGTGWCNRDGRTWFGRHGLDWRNFVKHGIDEEVLLATGDGLAQQLVAWAHSSTEGDAHG